MMMLSLDLGRLAALDFLSVLAAGGGPLEFQVPGAPADPAPTPAESHDDAGDPQWVTWLDPAAEGAWPATDLADWTRAAPR
jgi:hypothetical protein